MINHRSLFGIYHPLHKATLVFSDLIIIWIAFYTASQLRLAVNPDLLSVEYIILNLLIVSSLFIGGTYTSNGIASRPKLPLNTLFVVLGSAIPSLIFLYLLGPDHFTQLLGRGVYPFALALIAILTVSNRFFFNRLFHDDKTILPIVFLGEEANRERIKKALSSSPAQFNFDFKHSFDGINQGNSSAIVISPDHLLSEEEQKQLVALRVQGIPIFTLSDFFESFLFLVPVLEINDDWFIRTEGFTMLHSSVNIRLKRFLDIGATLLLLVITMPIIISAAILIKLTSRGPALFTQKRVGLKGQHFTLYKFRTMALGSESDGAQWAQTNDNRVIPFGRFLRATRIDEIPQCWNILKGEMSLIGPRPERPEFTEKLAKEIPYYELRHIVKPGLSGWAQVSYPYGASVEDALRKLQYDLYYIKNYSLILDLNILLRTVLVTLGRKGR